MTSFSPHSNPVVSTRSYGSPHFLPKDSERKLQVQSHSQQGANLGLKPSFPIRSSRGPERSSPLCVGPLWSHSPAAAPSLPPGMTRHGKNCTAGAVYTYHEKKKDTAASGYGTQNIRLSRDAVKDFDCCCLSLQPCHDPVVTPDGYLYEREAILEYILHQKKEIARQMKAYEKQRGARREEQKGLRRAAAQDQVRGFLEKEAAIVSRPLNPFTPKAASGNCPDGARPGSSAGPTGKDKDKALPSFWIPSLTPEAKATKLEKPSRIVTCPMSGKPLRMSDLTPVRFTPLDSSVDRVGLITRSERYVCAVTRDSLSNATPCAVLRPSGAVVTVECVEKLIRKDMVDPVTGEKLTDRDIIVLQRGGTGFAGSGVKLQAEKSRPVMQA
ncbi:nitric oxide synthase-interacting protein isoform X1 [Delphinapterus leucas]|uniref:Nitric oxide synthase-interacting protein n=3 Tax=Monodontidae TaxID=9747 RepID=A0A2Y9P160_DELLE|nr:nitric oxide synthase-interacting protein isoform X1 [Delphinapterus leucas]